MTRNRKAMLAIMVAVLLCAAAGVAAGCQSTEDTDLRRGSSAPAEQMAAAPSEHAQGDETSGSAAEGDGGSKGAEGGGAGPGEASAAGRVAENSDYFDGLAEAHGKDEKLPRETAEDGEGNRYLEKTLDIVFNRSCSEDNAREIVEAAGGRWGTSTYPNDDGTGYALVTAYFESAGSKAELESKAGELSELPEVAGAELSYVGEASQSASPSSQYYLTESRFYDAWDLQVCDHDVDIAVLDCGFSLGHDDLEGNYLTGWDQVELEDLELSYLDGNGHGTMVAGVACAECFDNYGIDGSSANACVVPVRVSDDPEDIAWSDVIGGLSAVCGMPVRPGVVNMSFAFDSIPFTTRVLLEGLIDTLHSGKTVLVAAAGNKKPSDATAWMTKYPAALDHVVSVGSVGQGGGISSFSVRNDEVDIVAAGEDVHTTANPLAGNGDYTTDSGTSLAAPQVAAAAALLKAAHPGWSADQVEQRLEASARKVSGMGGANRTDAYGYGVLDAYAALSGAVTTAASPNTGGSLADLFSQQAGKAVRAHGAFGWGSDSR